MEDYSKVEYYLIDAIGLFVQGFIWYLYYGLAPTLIWIVYRVFRKRREQLNLWKIN